MRLFITGGCGYVGSHCARRLRQAGHELLVYDNLSTGHRQAVAPEELRVGDLGDRYALRAAMSEFSPDAVMHFAASLTVAESVMFPLRYYRNNVVNTVNLLEAMEDLAIGKLVFSSSCTVYGVPPSVPITEDMPTNPISPYGRTKRMMEQALSDCADSWGLGFASLRYFNAAGASADGSIGEDHVPEIHLIPVVLEAALGKRAHVRIFGTDYDTPDGTCVRDYVHVDDLAEAHLAALGALDPGRQILVNLGTGRGYSVREVVETAERVTGREISVVEGHRRPGDGAMLYADASMARTMLNWRAKITDLAEIIDSAWQWHRHHPNGFDAENACAVLSGSASSVRQQLLPGIL